MKDGFMMCSNSNVLQVLGLARLYLKYGIGYRDKQVGKTNKIQLGSSATDLQK